MKLDKIHTLNVSELKKLLKIKGRKSKQNSWSHFSTGFVVAKVTADIVRGHTKSKTVKEQAARNKLINTISALEVYLKDLIVENANSWQSKGISTLLSEKVTLGKAYEIIHDAKISQIELIVHVSSFNSVEAINTVFSKLTDSEFIKTLRNNNNFNDNVISNASRAFLERNKFVHDKASKVDEKEVAQLVNAVVLLALLIHNYLTLGVHMTLEMDRQDDPR